MIKSESLQVAPERERHESVRMKPKLQWRPLNIGDARKMKCMPKGASVVSRATPREKFGL
jgi:hypothetical protein